VDLILVLSGGAPIAQEARDLEEAAKRRDRVEEERLILHAHVVRKRRLVDAREVERLVGVAGEHLRFL